METKPRSSARRAEPPPANAVPRRLDDVLDRAIGLYAEARKALESGAFDLAAIHLGQAGDWLSAWERHQRGSRREPLEAGGREAPEAGAHQRLEPGTRERLKAAEREAGALRRLVAASLEEVGASRAALRCRRRMLQRFGGGKPVSGNWMDRRG